MCSSDLVALLCFFGAGLLLASHNFYQVCDDQDAVAPMLATYHQGEGFEGDQEYAPPGTSTSLVAEGLPFACFNSNPTIPLGVYSADDGMVEWAPTQHSCLATFSASPGPGLPEHLRLTATLPQPGYLILRLQSYPAWRVKVNDSLISKLPLREDGLIAVPVPQGPVKLALDWTTMPDVLLGRWLSCLAVLALVALGLTERRLNGTHLS